MPTTPYKIAKNTGFFFKYQTFKDILIYFDTSLMKQTNKRYHDSSNVMFIIEKYVPNKY